MTQQFDLSSIEGGAPQTVGRKRHRNERISWKDVKDKKLKTNLRHQEQTFEDARKRSAHTDLTLTADAGFLTPEDEMERTYKFSQRELKASADVETRDKIFNLKLKDFGPYSTAYSRNGRHLALAGRKGHVSLLDWSSHKLVAELHVKERIRDITFLHDHTMFAVAQQKHVYIYDNQGVELHALRKHPHVRAMTFLPYHYLLCTIGKGGFLKYQDTSTGELVCEHRTRLGDCSVLTQNPRNAVIHLGHRGGRTTLWTPNMSTPAASILCHKGPVLALAVDPSGQYMVSSGNDGTMKVWDIRSFKKPHSYYTLKPATSLTVSQRGLLGVGYGPHLQIWKDPFSTKQQSPYMSHRMPGTVISDLEFCPYEDVLGIGHEKGFSSIVVPGAGEPNFDSMEANPFETKYQRRERTVHSLLEKIQPQMITLDPDSIGSVDPSQKDLGPKSAPPKLTKSQKNKARGRNTSSRRWRKKRANIVDEKTVEMHKKREQRAKEKREKQQAKERGQKQKPTALDRFSK